MVQPPTKRINISTRQSGLWDCKQKKQETVRKKRTGSTPILRDRQKRSDSLLYWETVRRDRTLCYTERPSEEIGLFAILRDRQKRSDSLLYWETVRRDRTLSKLQDCCSSSPTARVEKSEILLVDVRWTAFIYSLAVPTMQRAERSQASHIPSTNQDCLEFRQVMTPTGGYSIHQFKASNVGK